MNGILSQYLMRTILISTTLVLAVLLALAGLIEFIAELDDTRGDYQTAEAILFTMLRLPNLAFEMLPVATLIGSLLGLGGLAASSEFVVMRAAGITVGKLASMVALTGAVLLFVTGLIGEFIGPPLDQYARDIRNQARYQKEDARVGNAAWVKDGPVFLHLERVNAEFDFGSIYLYRFNEDNELERIAMAEHSGIDDNDRWILQNLRETRFSNDGVKVVESTVAVETFEVDSNLLGSSLAKPLSLSARGLLVYIDYLKRNDLDASRYESELWYRASRTLAVVIMPVLALAFVFGTLRTGGAGSRLLIGVIIGLVYYLGSEMLSNSGQVYNLNPIVINWTPAAILLLVTVIALARVR